MFSPSLSLKNAFTMVKSVFSLDYFLTSKREVGYKVIYKHTSCIVIMNSVYKHQEASVRNSTQEMSMFAAYPASARKVL